MFLCAMPWEQTGMERPKFSYNNPAATCLFCDRTHNPHPDFKHEPIVTTRLVLGQREREICINCYYDMLERANLENSSFSKMLEEKLNIQRILEKQGSSV